MIKEPKPAPTLKKILETANLIFMAMLTGKKDDIIKAKNTKNNYIHAMRRELEKTAGKQDFEAIDVVFLALISEHLNENNE